MTALYRDHYFETIELLDDEQREQIRNNDKDYIVLNVAIFNTGAIIIVDCTNDFPTEDFENGEVSVFDNDTFQELIDNYEKETGKNFYLTKENLPI